jgi:hypothetical protein
MATHSIAPATTTSFPPLLSANRQAYIIDMNAAISRVKTRSATDAALLEDIRASVREKDIVDALIKKIRDPYKDCVSTVLIRSRKADSLRVTGHDHAISFKNLLSPWGTVVRSLNDGLGRNFRVYPVEEGDEIVLYMEFKPSKPIMNPEDDEESVEVPVHPRSPSAESE